MRERSVFYLIRNLIINVLLFNWLFLIFIRVERKERVRLKIVKFNVKFGVIDFKGVGIN